MRTPVPYPNSEALLSRLLEDEPEFYATQELAEDVEEMIQTLDMPNPYWDRQTLWRESSIYA